MSDRASALLRRAASPVALVSLLALLLVGVGGATALARRSPAEDASVTIAAVATAPDTSSTPRPSEASPAVTSPPATSSPQAAAVSSSPSTSPAPSASGSPTATTAPITTPAPSATALATPSVAASAPPASTAAATTAAQPIIQAPASAGVGEAFALHVIAPGAATVTIELAGATYSASPSGDRFWLLLGVPVGAAPGPRTIRAVTRSSSGAILGSSAASLQYTPVTRPIDYLELTEEEGSVLTEEAGRLELALRAAQFAQFDSGKRWAGYFLRPLLGFQTTAFGQARSINGGPIGGFHSGMDIAADLGEPVRASAAGRVSWAGEMPIRGRTVLIDHGAGVKSGYHHLSEAFVSAGMLIEAGQVLGAAGSTGLSTGPHLHWEVTVWGVNVDPLQWTAESFEP